MRTTTAVCASRPYRLTFDIVLSLLCLALLQVTKFRGVVAFTIIPQRQQQPKPTTLFIHHHRSNLKNHPQLLLSATKSTDDNAVVDESSTSSSSSSSRRDVLLNRSGPHFDLHKRSGHIEFGETAILETKLSDDSNYESICEWLQNERDLAMSIWDEEKITELGDSVYRLQVMKIKFVTIELQPTVDVKMMTTTSSDDEEPVFVLESTDFEPNVKLFPGLGVVSAEALGIKIEVFGELKPTSDGKSVSGLISFQTTGKLPRALRILPTRVLRLAAETIDTTIAKFAIKTFEKSAIEQYQKFMEHQKGLSP